MPQPTKHICLWSGPRNISTALMYSFAQRKDTKVVDEPLYAHYLSHSPAKAYHPMAQEVLDSMEHNGEKIISEMLEDKSSAVIFYKQMTHHLIELDWSFLLNTTNVILTRDPIEMLPSFAKEISTPKMEDVGYQKHIELLDFLIENKRPPIIIDSKSILLNPQITLSKLCDALEIPFDESMLKWDLGSRPEDGVWAKHWYGNVHNSEGFMPYKTKTAIFPKSLKPLLNECLPFYEKLKKLSI